MYHGIFIYSPWKSPGNVLEFLQEGKSMNPGIKSETGKKKFHIKKSIKGQSHRGQITKKVDYRR